MGVVVSRFCLLGETRSEYPAAGGETVDEVVNRVDKVVQDIDELLHGKRNSGAWQAVRGMSTCEKDKNRENFQIVTGKPVDTTPLFSKGVGIPRATDVVGALPWFMPDANGPAATSTVYMNVFGNDFVCGACRNGSADYRGTVFNCCKAVVCSTCTTRVCAASAERMRICVSKVLSGSGRVLERVDCPSCGKLVSVGFPVNSSFGRINLERSEASQQM
jgi:hypothetical protein